MKRYSVLCLVVLAGCGQTAAGGGLVTTAGTPRTTEIETGAGRMSVTTTGGVTTYSQIVNAPAEAVWSALPGAFAALGISGVGVVAPNRSYGNPGLRVSGRLAGERLSRFLDCGMNPIGASAADSYSVETHLVASVESSGRETSNLQVQLHGVATSPAGGTRATCRTTGALEARIANQVLAVFSPTAG